MADLVLRLDMCSESPLISLKAWSCSTRRPAATYRSSIASSSANNALAASPAITSVSANSAEYLALAPEIFSVHTCRL